MTPEEHYQKAEEALEDALHWHPASPERRDLIARAAVHAQLATTLVSTELAVAEIEGFSTSCQRPTCGHELGYHGTFDGGCAHGDSSNRGHCAAFMPVAYPPGVLKEMPSNVQ